MAMSLSVKYGEEPVGRGMIGSRGLEIWTNVETGSWSILERYSNGVACLVRSGQNWEILEPEIPGDDT